MMKNIKTQWRPASTKKRGEIKNPMLLIALVSALLALLVVVVLKLLGYDNPAALGSRVAGAVAGAISNTF